MTCPGNLTQRQQLKLSSIQQTNQRLYRAYLLAQQVSISSDLPCDEEPGVRRAEPHWG